MSPLSLSESALCALLAGLLVFQVAVAMECSPNQIEVDGIGCCTQCSPGEGVISSCSENNDTLCEPCQLGRTFSNTKSEVESCQRCRRCGDNARLVTSCNTTHDTRCECKPDYFLDPMRNECRACDLCPVGQGVVSACTRLSNVRCRRCPNGTYSDQRTRTCVPCAVCAYTQIILRPCTSKDNTICMDMPIVPITYETPVVTDDEILPIHIAEENTDSHDVFPIYCSVLGLVLLGLLIYVIVMHKRKLSKQKATQQGATSCVEPEVPRSTKQGSDSGVCVEQDTKYALLASPIRELPAHKTSQLEAMLMSPREGRTDWRGLATEIGYTADQINNFERWSGQSHISPVGYLINEWGENETATMGALLRVLRTLHREDIVRMLQYDWKPTENTFLLPGNQEPLLV